MNNLYYPDSLKKQTSFSIFLLLLRCLKYTFFSSGYGTGNGEAVE